jgi:hypothetical protein
MPSQPNAVCHNLNISMNQYIILLVLLRSKDKNTAVYFVGYGGETCYILLTDHFTEKLHRTTRISKVPPVAWLRRFFRQHIPKHHPKDNRCIFLDQGGQLHLCLAIRDLLEQSSSSNSIVPALKPIIKMVSLNNQSDLLTGEICCMLWDGCLLIMFWPFAFFQCVCIKNAVLSHRGALLSGDEKASGKKSELSNIHTFGCHCLGKIHISKGKEVQCGCQERLTSWSYPRWHSEELTLG